MVSPSDKAALQDAPIEEIEFDAAETEELDKLAEETRKCGISLEDLQGRIGLVKRFPTRQEHPLASAASGLRPPLPTCFPATMPPKEAAFREPGPHSGPGPARQSPPGDASLCRLGESRIAAQAGRGWLWRYFRNPYSPSKMI